VTSLCFLLPVTASWSQEQPDNEAGVKFYVSPLKLEMPVLPGGVSTQDITILNQKPAPLTIKAYVMDYKIKIDNSFEFFPPGYETYSCANWISLSNNDFTLAGNQEIKVALTLTVPVDAEPSGHYAVVFFESVGKPLGENTTGVITQGRIGTLVLQSAPGKQKISGRISDFHIPKFIWSNPRNFLFGGSQSVPGRMVFENRGNVHLNLESKVEILGNNGKPVYESKSQRITILPKTKREQKFEWGKASNFGRFKAVLKTTYSDAQDTKTQYRYLTFYIVPIKALLITLLVIILIVVLTVLAYKLGKGRAVRKAGG
jgi:hypothetical protein